MSVRHRLHKMFGARPNKLTRLAVRRPVAYSVGTAALVAFLGFALLGGIGSDVALFASVIGGSGVLVLNIYLWRDGGPGARWYHRTHLTAPPGPRG